ncbi:MAG TPA: calcium-binding protein [Actinomycetota bacterium]|nr:calcium-binding protein [Actinomycetota bacterium]
MSIVLASGESVALSLSGEAEPRTIVVTPSDPSCEGFDTSTITTIMVNGAAGDEGVTIDQAGSAPFPNENTVSIMLALGDGFDALLIVGRNTADTIGFGADGISLDAGSTPDVTGADTVESFGVNPGGGDDVVSGKQGGDLGASFASPLSIGGDVGHDTLTGGSGDDTIDGGVGDDALRGAGGRDRLAGDTGSDVVSGGGNNDVLLGGSGGDRLKGADGSDTMRGDGGRDTMTGGEGSDSVIGGEGNDRVKGGKDDDVVKGNNRNDQLYGGPGNDHCLGGPGADSMTGCESGHL